MEKTFTRRMFLRTAGIGSAASILAACAPKIVTVTQIVEKEKVVEKPVEKIVQQTVVVEKQATVVVEKKVEVKAPEPKGEIEFWGHDQHPMDLAGEGFVKKYPQVKWKSPHPAERGQKLRVSMAAGAGCPDLYWAEATEAQEFGCQELLTVLDEWITPVKDQFHPAKLAETFIAKTGHYIGWPGDISVSGLYYRYDKFEAAGYKDVKWDTLTYDEYYKMTGDIAKKAKKYAFCAPQGWTALWHFGVHQVGGSGVSKDGQKLLVNSPEGIEAMKIVKGLYGCGGGLDVGWWSAPYWAAIQDGTLIGDFATAWCRGFWEAQIKTPDKGLGYWKIAPFPGGGAVKNRTGIWGGAQLINPKCSKNKDNAILYMQYALGSLEGCALTGGWGIIPSYRPYLASSLFLKSRSPFMGDFPVNEFWASQEKQLSSNFFRPAGWGAIDAGLAQVMPKIMKGDLTVEQGMAEADKIISPDFERAKCKA